MFFESLKIVVSNAGDILCSLFQKNIEIQRKLDTSLVTEADLKSNSFITAELQKILNIPVLSEEALVPYEERKNWKQYWLIDPLDGTKGFVNGNGEFTINTALMQENKPIVGMIYAPISKELHYACRGEGCMHENVPEFTTHLERPIISVSRHFHSAETQAFLNKYNLKSTLTVGAALKFGRLAVGQIDIYPRFQGSSEWDIAAGHLIVQEAGGKIIDLKTKSQPLYNKKTLENNFFIATCGCYKNFIELI